MKELKDIVASFDQAQRENQETALATVVHVEGSAYRQPGARMLITDSGALTGAISGGCLEGDTLRKARLAMLQKKNTLITYDTTDEDDAQLGMRLGCNGTIRILIEPVDSHAPENPIQLLKQFLQNRQAAALVTLFSLRHSYNDQPGTSLLVTGDDRIYSSIKEVTIKNALLADARTALNSRSSLTRNYPDDLVGHIEFLRPAVSLLVFGAGNDAIPLTKIAAILGWETTVIDWRTSYATSHRFPQAARLIVCRAEQALEQLTIDPSTVAILMTHNYNYDLNILRQLLPLGLPYLGSLGPKKKLERMRRELGQENLAGSRTRASSAEQIWGNVYGPTGLDIGAANAEEIALSIASEINKVLSGKSGEPLREKAAVHLENQAPL